MKVIISFAMFLFSALLFAQKPCNVVVDNDKLTRKTRVSTEGIKQNELMIYFIGGRFRSEYHKMFFKVDTDLEPCVDYLDNIYILFEDDSRIERGNVLDYNCDGMSSFIVNSKRVRDNLKNKKIVAIQVNTKRSNYRVEVSTENALILQEQYKCLESREYLSKVEYSY